MSASTLPLHPGLGPWTADRLEIAAWHAGAREEWPGRTLLTVVFQGCPWTCVNCPDPDLSDLTVPGRVAWAEILGVIQRSRSGLDGVLFAGGEPTRQDGLADAVAQVRALGLPIALRTSGAYPQRLAAVLRHVDRVVMDVKAPAGRYRSVTGTSASAHKAFASLRLALDAGVPLQVVTDVSREALTDDEITDLRATLAAMGVTDHVVIGTDAAPCCSPAGC